MTKKGVLRTKNNVTQRKKIQAKESRRSDAYICFFLVALYMHYTVSIFSAEEGTATIGVQWLLFRVPSWFGWLTCIIAALMLWAAILLWRAPPPPPPPIASDADYEAFQRDAEHATLEDSAEKLGNAPGEKVQSLSPRAALRSGVRTGAYRIFLGLTLLLLNTLPSTGISGWVYKAFTWIGAGFTAAGLLKLYLIWKTARD